MTVTFFGHMDTTPLIKPILTKILIDLIANKKADTFYVGNNGEFDNMVRNILRRLKEEFPHIKVSVVLAYLDNKKMLTKLDTIYPEGLEKIPLRFAICKRNEWMIKQSDVVVVYVVRGGGAHKYMELSRRKQKTIINIADYMSIEK